MRTLLLCTAIVSCFVSPLFSQLPSIERTVVQFDLDTPVSVPVGETFLVVFLPGSGADPFGPTPPNGDFVIVGGNFSAQGQNGCVASASCGTTELFDPSKLGFPSTDFLIAGADSAGDPVLSNHNDVTFVSNGSGLSCFELDSEGANGQHFDIAYAQKFDVIAPVDIESVLVGIEIAIEGNNKMGVDSDGDGVGDSAPIFDGFIPAQIMFFFGVSPVFDTYGSIVKPHAEFSVFIEVDFARGDINQDGAIDLTDVAPFVNLISSGKFQFEGDINEDGMVDLLDVAPFVKLLSGN